MLIAYWQYDTNQLTVKQAAEELGISESAVRKAIDEKRIRSVKRGNTHVIFKRSLENIKKVCLMTGLLSIRLFLRVRYIF